MVVVSRSHLGVVLKDSRVRNCSQHSELPEVSLPSYLVYMGREVTKERINMDSGAGANALVDWSVV